MFDEGVKLNSAASFESDDVITRTTLMMNILMNTSMQDLCSGISRRCCLGCRTA